jgi:uncharacterized protein (UPF0179 family)
MPKSAKPRRKYRPKPVLVNPLGYAVESMRLLADEHGSYLLDWRLKNNLAFAALLKGQANKKDLDTLVAARNLVEGLVVTLNGTDIDGTLARSACALIEICDRANAGKGTAMRAPEIQAMRDLMELHDDLLAVVTVKQFEVAVTYARKEINAGRAARLKEITCN